MKYRITDPRSPRYMGNRPSRRNRRPNCQHFGCKTIMYPGAPTYCYKHREESNNGN